MNNIKMKKSYFAIFLSLLLSASQAVAADTGNIQRNIDSQYQDKLRQFEMQNRMRFTGEQEKPLSTELPKAAGQKRKIVKIAVKHSDVPYISDRQINKIIRPYEGMDLSMAEIADMQQKLQQLYFDKGYSSTRIYIDGNTITENILTFVIIDGYIEDVVFERKSGRPYGKFEQTLQSFTFYPFAKGSLLNMKDLDQGLEQINRLATGNSSMEVIPGTKNGYSAVKITNNATDRFIVSLGADNSGVKSSGIYKANLSVSADNLLMLNDNLTFTYSNNIDGGDSKQSSSNYFASLSIPFGYFTFMASSFNSGYKTPAGVQVGSYTTDGSTRNSNVSLEAVIKRGQIHRISLGGAMALKDTLNNVDGQRLDSSSKKLAIASAFLTATYNLTNGSLYGKLSYNKGLGSFDSAQNIAVADAPMAQFYSLGLYAQYSKYFQIPLIKLVSSYSAVVNMQYSPDILYASEQINLGGLTSVRGFKEGSVSGDSGGYIRNELGWTIANLTGLRGLRGIFSDTSVSGFVDYGYARHAAYGADYQLAGAGAVVSYRMKYFNASCSWGRAIYNVSNLHFEGNVLYFSVEGKIYF